MNLLILTLAWLVYGAIHSFMASYFFKNLASKLLGKYFSYYRIIYNIIAFLLIIPVLNLQFSTPKNALWQVSSAEHLIGRLIAIMGAIIIAVALKNYDLGEFSGLKKARNQEKNKFRTGGLLKYVRHPIYFGILLYFWGSFLSDAYSRSLISAVAISIYLLIGIYFEEKKLVIEFGEIYKKYQKNVPMLLPFIKF